MRIIPPAGEGNEPLAAVRLRWCSKPGTINAALHRDVLRLGITENCAVSVPVVAIVGRPNVGKSSVFNWLAGRRIAIVDPTAGVTRDRVSTLLKVGDTFVELTDTGGMGIADVDNLTEQVARQIDAALEPAHVPC